MDQMNEMQNGMQTRAQKEGTSWVKIVLIIIGVIVGLFVILGILYALLLGSISEGREGARDARRTTDLDHLTVALSLYEDINGEYPVSLQVLTAENITPSLPSDPQTNRPYAYTTTQGGAGFCLGTCLESGPVPNNSNTQCIAMLTLSCESGAAYAIGPDDDRI